MKMSDLARLAGVSKSTVSRALADNERVKPETRRYIQQLAKKHNYRMDTRARNFRLKNVLTIGVLLPSNGSHNWLATNPFILEMIGALSDEIESYGHELLLAKHSNSDPAWLEDFVETRSVDGIIVLGQSIFYDILNRIAEHYRNMVVWGARLPGQYFVSVGSDNYLGGQLVARHLLEKKRESFLFIGDTRTPETKLRLQGFSDSLKAVNPGYEPEILNCADYQTDEACRVFRDYLQKQSNPADAIFASSDATAINILKELREAGLSIPSDVSVVGYDNMTLAAYLTPGLTSVDQNRQLAGKLLVEKLLAIINKQEPGSELLPTRLVVRDSS